MSLARDGRPSLPTGWAAGMHRLGQQSSLVGAPVGRAISGLYGGPICAMLSGPVGRREGRKWWG